MAPKLSSKGLSFTLCWLLISSSLLSDTTFGLGERIFARMACAASATGIFGLGRFVFWLWVRTEIGRRKALRDENGRVTHILDVTDGQIWVVAPIVFQLQP